MALQFDARSVSTDDLIARYQRGQAAAFTALFTRYKDYVYRIALLLLRNSSDAEEVVQETFIDVLGALPRYRIEGPARFETWLYRVTVNRCRMRQRRHRPPSADWDALAERLASTVPGHDPQATTQQGEVRQALWQAVTPWPSTTGWWSCCVTCTTCPTRRSPRSFNSARARSNRASTRRTSSCGRAWPRTGRWLKRQR